VERKWKESGKKVERKNKFKKKMEYKILFYAATTPYNKTFSTAALMDS
jgi:hypothetical protein